MPTPLGVTDRFLDKTGINVADYISDYIDFVEFDQPNIVGYYSGSFKNPNISSFSNLNELLRSSVILNSSIRSNENRFDSSEDWDLLEKIEDIKVKLLSVDKASKWLRSSITNGSFNSSPERDYSLNQNQSLEDVSRNIQNDIDPQNDYMDLAIRNDLNEEKYSDEGGILLKVELNRSGSGLFISSVIDNMIGERLYGLDLDKKITFIDDDLKVLSFKETVLQAISILAGLKKNDNPERTSHGVNPNLTTGTNRNALLFPVLFRQMSSAFRNDDTLASFSIINISFKEDALNLQYQVQTVFGDIFTNSVSI